MPQVIFNTTVVKHVGYRRGFESERVGKRIAAPPFAPEPGHDRF